MKPTLTTPPRLLAVLEKVKHPAPIFHGPELDARVTRRSTLWHRATSGWKVLFHQGNVVDLGS